jgi:hypothetical protein
MQMQNVLQVFIKCVGFLLGVVFHFIQMQDLNNEMETLHNNLKDLCNIYRKKESSVLCNLCRIKGQYSMQCFIPFEPI